jgi:hypothetical protein
MKAKSKRRKTGLIYALQDPDTMEVFYIGQTKQKLSARLRGHLNSHFYDYPVVLWIKNLKKDGKIPLIKVLKKCKLEDLYLTEKKMIKKYRKINNDLKNVSPGGKDWWGSGPSIRSKCPDGVKLKGSSFETWPTIIVFKSIKEACKHTGGLRKAIESVLDGKNRHSKGWFFCYSENMLKEPRDVIKHTKKVYCSNGQRYQSIEEAARLLNIHSANISRSIRQKTTAKKLRFALEKKDLKITKSLTTRIKCLDNGKIYQSLAEASNELGIDRKLISEVLRKKQRQTKGYSFEYVDENNRNKRRKKLIFTHAKSGRVIKFKSNQSAAKYFKVCDITISSYLSRPEALLSGYSVEIEVGENDRRLKKKPLKLARSIFCLTNGKIYKSVREAEDELGIFICRQLNKYSKEKRLKSKYQFLDLLTITPKCIGKGIRVECLETGEIFKTAFELSRSINEMLEIVIEHLQGKLPHLRNKTYRLVTKGLKPA